MTNPIEELKERVKGLEESEMDLSADASHAVADAIRLAECYREIAVGIMAGKFVTTVRPDKKVAKLIDQEASELFQGRTKE